MFIGRANELEFLEGCYENPAPQILVLYGREGIGKTELAGEFVKNKPHRYCYLEECSTAEQLRRLRTEWEGTAAKRSDHAFSSFLSGLAEGLAEREVWIFDEFQHAVRPDSDFVACLDALAGRPGTFILLLCSSVNWVENDLVKAFGRTALKLTSFLKLREWGFLDLVARFPNFRLEDCIRTYAVVGGVPKYLAGWDGGEDFRHNVARLFLSKDGPLYGEAPRFLKAELRELSIYNTILAAMASGATKLNDIREYTGFGRAKISVYLKNLIQLDLVEKVFSYDTPGRENTKKGVYRIRDFYLLFYYRYLFPNRSLLEAGGGAELYGRFLSGKLEDIWGECFKKVCMEYLLLMNGHGRLPMEIVRSGSWFGKRGDIDFLAEDEKGHMLAAFFVWQEEPVGAEEFERQKELLAEALVEPDYLYLFAKKGFSEELRGQEEQVVFMALEDM